ncbi:MAG: hypothetical protein JNL30_18470 [Rubrivivax sp.]|nr:hypothetical protein [Rubrivivax sp.]
MKTRDWVTALLAGAGVLAAGAAFAQASADPTCPRTRAEVRSECIAFLKTHAWDEQVGNYVLKSGAKPPEGVFTREEIRAERDKFMRVNRWDESKGAWVPLKGAPRDISKLSRAEVQKETAAFMRTHRFDELTGTYVDAPLKK